MLGALGSIMDFQGWGYRNIVLWRAGMMGVCVVVGFVVSAFSGYIWFLRVIDKCWKLFIIHGAGVLRTV